VLNYATKKTPVIVIAGLSLVTVFFISQIFHHGLHSLNQLSGWFSYKVMGIQGVMGAMPFMHDRQPLAHDQLNLGEWHGHNNVIWNNTSSWEKLAFDFSAEEDAYLWIFFAKDPANRYGVRLSRHPQYPSGFFAVDNSGKFLERRQIDVVVPDGWNKVRIEVSGSHSQVFLNSVQILDLEKDIGPQRIVNFVSGLNGVSVDNVSSRGVEANFSENFSPALHWGYVLAAGLMYGATFLLLLFFFRRMGGNEKVFSLVTAQIMMLTLVIFYSAFDFYVLGPRYFVNELAPFNRVQASRVNSMFETERERVFRLITKFSGVNGNDRVEIPPKIWTLLRGSGPVYFPYHEATRVVDASGKLWYPQKFADLKGLGKGTLNIAFIGSSQTWGAGANEPKSAFVPLAHKILSEKLGVPIMTVNLSICGSHSTEQLQQYEAMLPFWKPDILFVNLSSNDGHIPVFEENLRKIAALNKKEKIETIFVLEANDPEFTRTWVTGAHEDMVKVARENHIATLNLHGFLHSPEVYDSGLIWIDMVHLMQYGQNIVAEWLAEQSLPIVTKVIRTRGRKF
jgi:lysophospholipase L1-like esterase